MNTIIFFSLVSLLECEGLTFLPKTKYNDLLQVVTDDGVIQGMKKRTVTGTRYFSYEGIPFAQPPIDFLRFRDPKPAKPWKTKGVLEVTKQGPTCNQLNLLKILSNEEQEGQEDCLYLNVYSPINIKVDKNDLLPILFWIHGGAFMNGSAWAFGPDYLLDKKMVIVTFNYRLGPFGFLSTEDEASPGNYGLKDQNAALKWVNKNIEKFGGDPRKVTISGHSAGASSVIYHMLSPLSRGLFHAAIAWSGDTTTTWANQKRPKSVALDLARSLEIKTDNTTKMLEKLRREDVKNIMLEFKNMFVSNWHVINKVLEQGLFFTPCVEPNHPEAFITEKSYEMLKRGDFARIPLMIGTANMELGVVETFLFFLQDSYHEFDTNSSSIPNGIDGTSSKEIAQIGDRIKEKYFKSHLFEESTNEEIINFFTDIFFTLPITKTIKAMSSYIQVYYFVSAHPDIAAKEILTQNHLEYINTSNNGVVHGEDLVLISYDEGFRTNSTETIHIQKKFLQMWKNFATFGNPTPTYDPMIGTIWPPVTKKSNSYLLMEDDTEIAFNYKKDILSYVFGISF